MLRERLTLFSMLHHKKQCFVTRGHLPTELHLEMKWFVCLNVNDKSISR